MSPYFGRELINSFVVLLLLASCNACEPVHLTATVLSTGGNVAQGGGPAQGGNGGAQSSSDSATSGFYGTGATSIGGTDAAGGTTSASAGGTVSEVDTTTMANSGGTQGAGGTKTTDGTQSTGGIVSTGGDSSSTIPTGLPSTCGSNNCDAAASVNPKLTSYGALGNVTMYSTIASNGGACQYGNTSIMYFAAINVNLAPGDGKGQWQGGALCGQCMEVTVLTSQGTQSVVVRIMDKCADDNCGIDLGGSAPTDVMSDGIGRYMGAWREVPCAGHSELFDGSPSLYVKDGSSIDWSAVQVRNPMTAVAGIDWNYHDDSSKSGTLTAASGIENYYSVPLDLLKANTIIDFTIRYVDGTTTTTSVSSAQLSMEQTAYTLS